MTSLQRSSEGGAEGRQRLKKLMKEQCERPGQQILQGLVAFYFF